MTVKKLTTLLFLTVISFISCEKIEPNENNLFKGKGSTLISKEDSTNYYFELRNIKTKYDVKTGEKQCKNYRVNMIASNEFYTYGLGLKNCLSNLLGIPEKDISYQNTDFDKFIFELNYKVKNNLERIDKNLVSTKILEKYNFELKTDSAIVRAYNLKIIDSLKLENSISKNKIGESNTRMSNYEAELNGISLKHLANFLNLNSPIYHFCSEIDSESFYDFKIKPKSNIKHLNEDLEEKYGLNFKADSLKIKRIIIKTAANKV